MAESFLIPRLSLFPVYLAQAELICSKPVFTSAIILLPIYSYLVGSGRALTPVGLSMASAWFWLSRMVFPSLSVLRLPKTLYDVDGHILTANCEIFLSLPASDQS